MAIPSSLLSAALVLWASGAAAQPCGNQREPPCSRWVCDHTELESALSSHYDLTCNGGLQNINGLCSRCGAAGEVTCVNGPLCGNRLNAVPPVGGGGICATCGGLDRPGCASGMPCDSGLSVVLGICKPVPCGGIGQLTCAGGTPCTGRANAIGPPGGGVCAVCGGLGQPVCRSGGAWRRRPHRRRRRLRPGALRGSGAVGLLQRIALQRATERGRSAGRRGVPGSGSDGRPVCRTPPECNPGLFASVGLCWVSGDMRTMAVILSGTFRAGPEPTALGRSRMVRLSAKWAELESRGLRMQDFETYTHAGRRLFAGVFRAGSNPPLALIGKEWPEFKRDWDRFESQGFRMQDVEIWRDGGKRKSAALVPGDVSRPQP